MVMLSSGRPTGSVILYILAESVANYLAFWMGQGIWLGASLEIVP